MDTPYREGGWTVRQLVHHLADSHINAYCRFKLTITQHEPTILPYNQDSWADTIDSLTMPVDVSVRLLNALHERWYRCMTELSKEVWNRKYYHPEQRATFSLFQLAANYAWHSEHHLRHITDLKERENW